MPLPLVLAIRSLVIRRFQTGLAILGVALGVLALTLILGIQNGFREAFVRQILETSAHLTLAAPGARLGDVEGRLATLRALPGVSGAAPAILGQGILEAGHAFSGVNFKAIDPEQETAVTRLLGFVIEGEASFSGPQEILVGSRLAKDLRLKPGDPVKLVLPGGELYDMWVRGVLDSGVGAIDAQTILVSLRFAARAMGFKDGVSHLFVACRDPEQAPAIAAEAARATGLVPETWQDSHRTLLKAMELERRAMFVIIALTLMVAGFGVSNVLTLMVTEKYRDVGILRSLGLSASGVLGAFLFQGLLIGIGGTLLGVGLSLGLGSLLEIYPIPLPGDIYYADTLPIRFSAREFLAISVLSLVVTALAGLPSARKAVRVDPAEVVHGAW